MSTFETAKTAATSEEAQAAKDGDTEKLVRLAATAGCAAMTGGVGAPFCAFAFGGGFEKAMDAAFQALPSSARAQGEVCYPCITGDFLTDETMWRTFTHADGVRSEYLGQFFKKGVLPTAQRYVDAGVKGLNEAYHRSRQVMGLSPKAFDVWPSMQAWLYAQPGRRWNSAPWIEGKDGRFRIELLPDKGPWAYRPSGWPKRPDDCPTGCDALFAKTLTDLYRLRLVDFDVCLRQAEKDIAAKLEADRGGYLKGMISKLNLRPMVSQSVLSQIRRDPYIPAGMLARFAKGPDWTPFYGPGHFERMCVGAGIALVAAAALWAAGKVAQR